jgi:hypothetical protein
LISRLAWRDSTHWNFKVHNVVELHLRVTYSFHC